MQKSAFSHQKLAKSSLVSVKFHIFKHFSGEIFQKIGNFQPTFLQNSIIQLFYSVYFFLGYRSEKSAVKSQDVSQNM